MNKSIVYLSILFCFQLSISQESEIQTIKPKSNIANLNEPYLKYHDNGKLKISGQKSKGVRIGDWKDYYDNAQVCAIYSYTEGKRDIPQKRFYKNGNIKYVIKGSKDKSYKTEYYETGELFVERQIKTGNYKEYLKDGTLKVNCNYTNYNLTGLWVGFSNTGQKEWEVNYLDGYLSGAFKQFYISGKIKAEGKYHENKKQGKEKHFTEEGKLDWEGFFDKGIPVSKWKKYNKEEKVVAFNKFKGGVLIKNSKTFTGKEASVPEGIIFTRPIYPGCKEALGPLGKKKCMNSKIKEFVVHFFNKDIATQIPNLSGVQKIKLDFKINKKGKVVNIRVRAPHKALIEEVKKIASYIPPMTPATKRGKKVIVPYYLPIKFVVKK